MIRSVYETVTDSCTAFLLDDKPISQRVPTFGSLQRRGLLAYEETGDGTAERRWVLYSTFAEKVTVKVNGTTFRDENGRTITGRNGDFVTSRGWLQYNIPVNTKKPYHIAYLKENEKSIHGILHGKTEPQTKKKMMNHIKLSFGVAGPSPGIKKQ